MAKIHPLLEIEQRFPVEKIKVNQFYFWPFLRNYIGSQIHFNQDRQVKVSTNNFMRLFKSAFYGFFNLFVKAEHIYLSSSDQRRRLDTFTDRMDFFIEKSSAFSLLLELPNPKHFPKSETRTKNISSKIPLYVLEKVLSKFIKVRIENEEVIQAILKEYELSLDYTAMAKNFLTQYKVYSWFFKQKQSKKLFLTASYINCARVKAAKDLAMEVVEFQHGIINKFHYGYAISKHIDDSFYPDVLLTFGKNEIAVFDETNHYIAQQKVKPIGSFYIDYLARKDFSNKKIESLRTQFEKIVCFSAQDAMEDLWIPFLKEIAQQNKALAFVLMPRHKTKSYYSRFNFSENVHYVEDLNTYQIIKLSDVHVTINSTTAIEALSLGTQNILYNVNNLAKQYLEKVLKDYSYYVNTAEDFSKVVQTIEKIDKKEIMQSNNDNILFNFKENINSICLDFEK